MKIKDIIKTNEGFKSSINLYLNLNDIEKIKNYIPTSSSVFLLDQYLDDIINNRNQATLLIGPYGKGKSHLLLILLSIISMDRQDYKQKIVIEDLTSRIKTINENTASKITKVWGTRPLMPVLINGLSNDLNQAFLLALNNALKRENIEDIIPDTYFSKAIKTIDNWEMHYENTYANFVSALAHKGIRVEDYKLSLNECDSNSIEIFRNIYPQLTSGSEFSPLVGSDVLILYQSINAQLCQKYNYGGIYIVFDEFSKFIEDKKNSAASNEMKLLQDICELASDSSDNKIHLTMVAHKSIKEYGKYLSREFINSFTGIEGRIEERHFLTSAKNNYELIKSAIIKKVDLDTVPWLCDEDAMVKCYNVSVFRSLFKYDDFKTIVAKGCYPLHPMTTYTLLNISEKVAQNERTLFTFLSKGEKNSMTQYIKNSDDKFIYVPLVYDYFREEFKKNIENVFIHNEWLKVEYAISRAVNEEERNVLKTIGLINILNRQEEIVANEELISLASGVDDARIVLDHLTQRDLLRFKPETGVYLFKTSIAVDLNNEIKKRAIIKGGNININRILLETSGLDYVLPKEYNQKYCMTRYYRYTFMDYEVFLDIGKSDSFFSSEDFCDGVVILLTIEKGSVDNEAILKHVSQLSDGRIVIVLPNKPFCLQEKINYYEILQVLKRDESFLNDNKGLINEIELYEEELTGELKAFSDETYFSNFKACVFNSEIQIGEMREGTNINKIVSNLCDEIYYSTPIINNEMINKQYINSPPIRKARKLIIDKLIGGWDLKEKPVGTSPEDSICRAVFFNSVNSEMRKKNFDDIIHLINLYVGKCAEKKVGLKQLINILQAPPYGVRRGIIPMILTYALKDRIDNIIIYFGKAEVRITGDIMENIVLHPDDYMLFISKENAEKETYLAEMYKLFDVDKNYNLTGSRINDILASMKKWFRALPQVTRNRDDVQDQGESNEIYNAHIVLKQICQSVENNPYESLFEEIPRQAFHTDSLIETYNGILHYKKMMENYLENLLSQASHTIKRVFGDKQDPLNYLLKDWYEHQSDESKYGLFSNEITGFMHYIGHLDDYDDEHITKKIIKIVTGTYIENWNKDSLSVFTKDLTIIKKTIENIQNFNSNETKSELVFTDKNGKTNKITYDPATENTAIILKNIIGDALDEFYSISINDKIAVLIEMLEKTMMK